MKTLRIAIVGAGAAGLCAARHVASRPNMQPFVFERSKEVGGVWCYSDKVGNDDYGLGIHSAMYQNLRTNLPKEVMEFPDFPFAVDTPSFSSHEGVKDYLSLYCSHFSLEKYIQFESLVQHVKPVQSGNDCVWEVTIKNLPERSVSTALFDAVFVCNGHYATPFTPFFPGEQNFKGSMIHSHSFRYSEPYQGKNVLVLGCGSSGQDISLDVAKYAKSVVISHRTKFLKSELPENVTQAPPVASFKDNGVTVCLEDGSEREVNSVIYCTGYKYNFPFLDESCDITVDGGRICHLYKHMINPTFPSLLFIGICGVVCPFPQFHHQVLYCLATLDGSLKLPSRDEMLADIEKDYQNRLENGIPHRKAHMLASTQWAYNNYLADAAEVQRLHPRVEQLYKEVALCRSHDLLHYRSYKVTTLDTGYYELSKD